MKAPPAVFSLHHSIWRAGGLLRYALLVLACAINGLRDPFAAHPWWLLGACGAMLVWSTCTWFWNQNPARRTWVWMSLDVAVTLALVLSSRPILGVDVLKDSYLGVTVYWMAAAPMAMQGPMTRTLDSAAASRPAPHRGAAGPTRWPPTGPRSRRQRQTRGTRAGPGSRAADRAPGTLISSWPGR